MGDFANGADATSETGLSYTLTLEEGGKRLRVWEGDWFAVSVFKDRTSIGA